MVPDLPILPETEWPPEFDRSKIPADQMQPFFHILTQLSALARYERDLHCAVFIYDYSRILGWTHADPESALWTTGGWQMMAGRDGALTIYHFGRAIEGLKASLPLCPALNTLVDRRELKNAGHIYDGHFPNNTAIRHVVAHVADFSMTPKEQQSHAVKGPFKEGRFSSTDPQGITWLHGNMNENHYAVTYEGKAFTYELSLATVNKIRSIKKRIYSAFTAATIKKPAS